MLASPSPGGGDKVLQHQRGDHHGTIPFRVIHMTSRARCLECGLATLGGVSCLSPPCTVGILAGSFPLFPALLISGVWPRPATLPLQGGNPAHRKRIHTSNEILLFQDSPYKSLALVLRSTRCPSGSYVYSCPQEYSLSAWCPHHPFQVMERRLGRPQDASPPAQGPTPPVPSLPTSLPTTIRMHVVNTV